MALPMKKSVMKTTMKSSMKAKRVYGFPAMRDTRASALLVRKNPVSRGLKARGQKAKAWTLRRRSGFCSLTALKKRLGIGTSRWNSKRRTGFSAICSSSWRRSGTSATCCGSLLSSGTCNIMDEKHKSTEDGMLSKGPTVHEMLIAMIGVGKEAVMKEIHDWNKVKLTGRAWNGLIVKWATSVRYMISQLPMLEEMEKLEGKVRSEEWMDFFTDQVISGIFWMTKEIAFFMEAGCIYFEEISNCKSESQELNKDGSQTGGGLGSARPDDIPSFQHTEKTGDEGVGDQMMQPHVAATGHVSLKLCTQLRGGMVASQAEADDWTVVMRRKPYKGKSFYPKMKWKVEAVENATVQKNQPEEGADWAALGSVEDAPQDCSVCTESEVDMKDEKFQEQLLGSSAEEWDASGILDDAAQESSFCSESDAQFVEAELRGGAGGAATSARKKKVGEAVQKMEEILKDLHTQQDPNGPDEVDAIIADFAVMVKGWEEQKPMKEDLKKQLEGMINKLKGSATGSKSEPSKRQSFYAEFHKKAQEDMADRQKQKKDKGKGKGKGKTKNKSDQSSLPKYDLRQAFPMMSISSWITIHRDIEDGKEPIGTVAICPNLAMVSEIQALSAAHELQKEVLLITKPDAKEAEEVEVKGAKKALLPYQGNLALVEAIIATSTGKEPSFGGTTPVKAVAINRSLKKTNLVSLRIMVVKGVLDQHNLVKMKADPTFALHLLDCDKELEELKTAGWTEQSEAFVGYLEIEKEKTDTILKISGHGGVFISALRKNVVEWPNVSWRLPEGKESMVDYHERIWKNAKELGKPMAFRRGGGACFGIVMPEKEEDEVAHSWTMIGTPHSWGPVSVREWLERQGWAILDCTQPRRRDRPWTFRGRLPGQVTSRAFAYEIPGNEEENTVYVHITRWEKRRKADEEVTPLASSKLWWSKNATYEDQDPIEEVEEDEKNNGVSITQTWTNSMSATLIDPSAEDGAGLKTDGDEPMNGKNKDAPEGNSPPKKRSKQAKKPDIDKVIDGENGPEAKGIATVVVDTGGKGDCGWRAISYAIAGLNNHSASDEKLMERLSVLSKAMQAKVTTYLINHKQLWEASWAPDSKSNIVMEAGPVPTSVAEYCEAIRRPQRWMDGMLLASTAVLQKVNIIIWTKKNGAWKRLAILKSGDDWKKSHTVPLILSRGHYVTLRHRKGGWPTEWITEAEDELPCSQGIDTQFADLNPVLGRAGMLHTPLDKIRKRRRTPSQDEDEDDVDAMLRTCSSRNSGIKKKKDEADDDLDPDVLLRSCASRGTSSPGEAKGPRQKKKWQRAPNPRIAVNGSRREWTCPICHEVLNVAKGDTIDRKAIQNHVQGTHKDHWIQNRAENAKHGRTRSNLGLRQLVWPVAFKKIKEEDIPQQAHFICPYCELCLPKIDEKNLQKKGYLILISKQNHLKHCPLAPTDISLKMYTKAFVEKYPTLSILMRTKRARKKQEEEKPRKRIRAPNQRLIENEGKKEWLCPFCPEVINVIKDGKIDRRDITRHLQDNHNAEWVTNRAENAKSGKTKSNLGLRDLTWPIPFVQMKSNEMASEAVCVCPYCELCLPKIDEQLGFYKKKYLISLSKKHHIASCKKAPQDVNLKMFQKAIAGKVSRKSTADHREQRGPIEFEGKLEKAKSRGHDPIEVDFGEWARKRMYGSCFLLCLKCRSILKLTHRSRMLCKGSCCQSLSPGLNFWAEAEKSNRLDEMYQKLQLEAGEVCKVQQALQALDNKQC